MLWMAERLEEEGDRMLQEIEDDRGDIDALFAELDVSLAQSRKVSIALSLPCFQSSGWLDLGLGTDGPA